MLTDIECSDLTSFFPILFLGMVKLNWLQTFPVVACCLLRNSERLAGGDDLSLCGSNSGDIRIAPDVKEDTEGE